MFLKKLRLTLMEGILVERHVEYVVDGSGIKLTDTAVLHFSVFCKKVIICKTIF